ncbi:MAG TPA: FtsX-like permease family protein [Verrucomicrobiae bacterium]|nr:FtsX-like permease family protein [Verrucomicrobiae bacterium]
MGALDRKLLRDLGRLRGQLIAVALVVACGIAAYVTMRSAYQSLVVSQAAYYQEYRFANLFAHLKRAPNSLAERIARIPGVAQVQTRIVMEVNLDVPGLEQPATGRMVSIPEKRVPMLNDLHLRAGRYIEPGRRGEVLASEAFATANELKVGDRIGAVLNGRWEELQIVGIALSPEYVYEIRGTEVLPDNRRFGVFWMGREALAAAFNMEGAFNDLALTLAPGAVEAEVISRLDALLSRYGGLGTYSRSEQISHRFLSDEIAQDRITGLFVPSIFLAVAAFLIHIVLTRLVGTQRPQIGVLKAFGYGNWEIGAHYLKFAWTAVFAGTVLGVALGIWFGKEIAELYSLYFHFPVLQFVPDFWLIGLAIFTSAASAGLGALTSVRSAVALPPAEAMRPPAPARFRTGWAERLGLSRFFSIPARMILRNLERRPLKAFLSLLGIAWAVAILLLGRYFFDAVDKIIDLQFRAIQREDMTVLFATPLPGRVRYELNQLEGVRKTEPFRAVPVRLRFGHRAKRLGLFGLEPEGKLRTLLDKNEKKVFLPPEGLVLTSKLAEILGAARGDTLTLEVLEGERPVRRVVLVGLVDEMVGVSAYMDRAALGRLLREEGNVSGAFLAVDPPAEQALYAELKKTPAVAGVAVRSVMLESFQKSIAESLTVTTTVLILFACVIAVAVVYNSARIALSERGRELASLRVLGFSKKETAFMLVGEQSFLTIAALPFGLVLGYAVAALLSEVMESELYRMPLAISGRSFVFSIATVGAAAFLSALVVVRLLNRLDLVSVLKTGE